jgi:hypothetical protein
LDTLLHSWALTLLFQGIHIALFFYTISFLTGQEKKEIHMVDTKPRTAFIYSTQLEKYRYPPSFPLVMKRAGQTYSLLLSTGLLTGDNIRTIAPKPATRTEIMKFHSANYLDVLVLAAEGKVTADGFRMGLGHSIARCLARCTTIQPWPVAPR